MTARLVRIAAGLLAVVAVAAALQLLAHWQLRRQLAQEAAAFLTPLAHGDTPYRWPLRAPDDLIGGRAFGDCDFAFDAVGLVLRRGSASCEIGIPLRHALDLRRFDRLQIDAAAPLPPLWLLLRERLDDDQHVAPVVVDVSPSQPIELARLPWHRDSGGTSTPPRRAAMLRLRFGTLTQDLRLQGIALLPDPALARSASHWLPADGSASPDPARLPLFAIDGISRPETLLRARDVLREREPAALLVFRGDIDRVAAKSSAPPRDPAPVTSLGSTLFLLALALAMLATLTGHPRADRQRALLQALLAVALPLWLVVGQQLGDDMDRRDEATIALAVLYAAALAWTDTATRWRWFGTPRAWLWAGAAPVLGLGLAFWLGRPGTHAPFSLAALAGYALWALAQQYLICAVFADRLRRAGLPAAWTILAAASVFALLHAPNAALMLATLAGGLIWCAVWLRERSLLPLALSHAVAALLLAASLPPAWLRSAEVSLRYYL